MVDEKGAGVRIPPPVVYIFFMLIGVGLDLVLPLNITVPKLVSLLGIGFTVLGIVTLLYLAKQFKRVNTHIEPWKPTSTIMTGGFYAYSRNPIYLIFCTIPIGLGLFFSQVWLLLSVLPSCLSIYYIAIKPEEAYLADKFGDEYLSYKKRVRRWL